MSESVTPAAVTEAIVTTPAHVPTIEAAAPVAAPVVETPVVETPAVVEAAPAAETPVAEPTKAELKLHTDTQEASARGDQQRGGQGRRREAGSRGKARGREDRRREATCRGGDTGRAGCLRDEAPGELRSSRGESVRLHRCSSRAERVAGSWPALAGHARRAHRPTGREHPRAAARSVRCNSGRVAGPDQE